MIPVKYIGHRPRYRDGTYGSGIEWEQGETKPVDDALALKLLKHTDVYVLGDDFAKSDLVLGKKEADPEATEEDQAREDIRFMSASALKAYALQHFKVRLDGRKGVDSLRQEVGALIDRFGPA